MSRKYFLSWVTYEGNGHFSYWDTVCDDADLHPIMFVKREAESRKKPANLLFYREITEYELNLLPKDIDE